MVTDMPSVVSPILTREVSWFDHYSKYVIGYFETTLSSVIWDNPGGLPRFPIRSVFNAARII